MANTRVLLLETNSEVYIWGYMKAPLLSVAHKYVVHCIGGFPDIPIQGTSEFDHVMNYHFNRVMPIHVSSIYDYHYTHRYIGDVWTNQLLLT